MFFLAFAVAGSPDSVRRLAAEPVNGTFEARNLTLLARHFEYILQESRAVEAEVKALVNEEWRPDCSGDDRTALESIGQVLDAAARALQLRVRVPPTKQSTLWWNASRRWSKRSDRGCWKFGRSILDT